MGKLVLVLGGARSGKSSYAQKLAKEISGGGSQGIVYLATAEAGDEEMHKRIERHRWDRPASWETIQESMNVTAAIRSAGDDWAVIILDCLTLLVSNLLLVEGDEVRDVPGRERAILKEVEDLIRATRKVSADVIVVSNEVGLGVVPPTWLGRIFRDIAGRANQVLARAADEVYVMWAGLPQKIKGAEH